MKKVHACRSKVLSHCLSILTLQQLIDYRENNPLTTYFSTDHKDNSLDSIPDAVGSQDLSTHCAAYLKPNGT